MAKLDRGVALARQGKQQQALALFEEILAGDPRHAGAHMNRGILLADLKRYDDAAASYRRALEVEPDNAGALSNLGVVLGQQDRHDEALDCYRRALAAKPDFAEGWVNIASVYHKQEKWDEAAGALREALKLRPGMTEARFCLGVNHFRRERFEEAEAELRQTLRARPDHVDARLELAMLTHETGRTADVVAVLRDALRFRPDHEELHTNLGIVSLLAGDFADGWLDYEWRMHCPGRTPPKYPRPLWDGSPLDGRKILLHFEQGLGDTIQFARYAALVKARGGRVLLGSPKPLVGLLSTCPGVEQIVVEGERVPVFDVHASVLTLPGLLGTDLSNIPADVPYLSADPERRRRWRERLADVGGFKVGVVWRGNAKHPGDRQRSIPLARFEPLARLPGVRLISLQKDRGEAEMRDLGASWGVLDVAGELHDFQDTAALIAELDLLVCCDTSVAHLAGALAAPVWVALPFVPDWRWLLGREDTPWYPTMRLFRQRARGDWPDVFARMAEELRARRLAPVTAPTQPEGESEDVHGQIRDVEAAMRRCEARGDFGAEFIGLARRLLRLGERREAGERP